MKKSLSVICVLLTVISLREAQSSNYDGQIQMLESEVAKLTAEKQQKYEELEKCASSVSGFKIAGISLLGLTAVGVGVNIYQASARSDLKMDIAKTQGKIAGTEASINSANADLTKKTDCENKYGAGKCEKQKDGTWAAKPEVKKEPEAEKKVDENKTEHGEQKKDQDSAMAACKCKTGSSCADSKKNIVIGKQVCSADCQKWLYCDIQQCAQGFHIDRGSNLFIQNCAQDDGAAGQKSAEANCDYENNVFEEIGWIAENSALAAIKVYLVRKEFTSISCVQDMIFRGVKCSWECGGQDYTDIIFKWKQS